MSTGLTLNILARVAIMLALRDGSNIININPDTDGQELNKSVLFGDHEHVYEVMIKQFIHKTKRYSDNITSYFVPYRNRGAQNGAC